MLANLLKQLIDERLTSVREVESITGRTASTVYRWLAGQTRPDFEDVRLLIGGMRRPEARRRMLGLVTAELPVVMQWIPRPAVERSGEPRSDQQIGEAVMDATVEAIRSVNQTLEDVRTIARGQRLNPARLFELVDQLDRAIGSLLAGRMHAASLCGVRASAKKPRGTPTARSDRTRHRPARGGSNPAENNPSVRPVPRGRQRGQG